ncbi:MAG TPA: galactonate dehydratase [Chloroflexota bacterium]|nr:galactonate dehydratase [Chloroflexota bacterium]
MKISNIECYPVWGGSRNYFFVVVDTEDGIYGVGEAGITGRELGIQGVIEHFKPLLIGQDARRIEHLWQMLYRGGFFPGGKIITAAVSAIDIALWDIKGKALGVPVYELLGGLCRDKVVCYPHCQRATLDQLVENAQKHVQEGWKFVRWGLSDAQLAGVLEPGRAVRGAIKEFEALRTTLGDDVELCFDIHTRLDPPDAIQLCNSVEQYRPFFMEDPIRSESMQSLRVVREHVNTPLAIGEQFAGKWEFRQVIEEELMDYCRVDLGIVGGLTEAKKVAGWCETHYIKLATHNPLGPISTAACLQLNLACNNVAVQEQPRKPGTALTDVVPVQVEWKDGYLLPPTRPGLGIEFDREAAKKHPFQMAELPHLRREDGSVTNW